MRYADRKTNTHIHPDGKLEPQIHVIVGGNPGEHAISTHGDTQEIKHTDSLNVAFMGE